MENFETFSDLPKIIQCKNCNKKVNKNKAKKNLPIGIVTGLTLGLFCPFCDSIITKFKKQ